MLYVWIAVFAVAVIVEVSTVQLVCVWFALGALGAFIAALCGVEAIWLQIVIFTVVSLVSLILTRPFIRKFVDKVKQPTNADMVIGQDAVVKEEINNLQGVGQVSVKGSIWSARSVDGSVIKPDTIVEVKSIEGVRLFVSVK